MKRFFISAIALVMFSFGAHAQQATVWQGTMMIGSVTPECVAAGIRRGDRFFSVFRPANIGTNGTETRVTINGSRAMARMVIAGQNFVNNGTYTGTHLSSRGGQTSYTGAFENVLVIPATFNENRIYVQVNARYTNFFNNTGCTVFVRTAYIKRPD
ncbi:MAG: hypothetical protein KKB37_06750 [Alphaproteobacteria bacterium]|nr:hypothetical protein [Alphaproteobacteria bacterium]